MQSLALSTAAARGRSGRLCQGGVPHQHAGLLGAAEHFGAQVFDRLEAADLAAELLT
jgi:hypothetical protein